MNDLKNRGLKEVLIACIEGLTGFLEAIEATFPQTLTQLCIVQMVRNSLKVVPWKDRKQLAKDFKTSGSLVTQIAIFTIS